MTRRGAVQQSDVHAARLAELDAEARYASDRYRLYKARVLGPSPTSPGRLRELERSCQRAESRLRRAKSGETRLLTALKDHSSPARQAGKIEKTRDDDENTGHFRLTSA